MPWAGAIEPPLTLHWVALRVSSVFGAHSHEPPHHRRLCVINRSSVTRPTGGLTIACALLTVLASD